MYLKFSSRQMFNISFESDILELWLAHWSTKILHLL